MPIKNSTRPNELFFVDFAPAAGGDDRAHKGSCESSRHCHCRGTRAVWEKAKSAASAGKANSKPGTRTGTQANESITPAMAFLPNRHSRNILLGEHLRTFSGGHHQRVVSDPVDFAADRARTGRDRTSVPVVSALTVFQSLAFFWATAVVATRASSAPRRQTNWAVIMAANGITPAYRTQALLLWRFSGKERCMIHT
jgi:hypothetical protein